MRGSSIGKLTVLVLLAGAVLLGWAALELRRTRSGSPTTVYAGPDGRAEDVQGPVAFVDVNVITMESEVILPRHTVRVEGGKIVAVGPARSTSIPSGSYRVDGRGRFLIPGLSEATRHGTKAADLLPYVTNGVTTVLIMSDEPDLPIHELGEKVATGEVLGPTLYVVRPAEGSREEWSDAGAPLLLGMGSPPIPVVLPGSSVGEELRNMVDSGLTPYEALAAGTRNAGQFAREHVPGSEPFGTIAIGQRADLVLLNENPLEDVRNVQERSGVMVRGRWLSEARLEELLQALAESVRTDGDESEE
jgi:imidazolonepropionase-like amidohydrolase